MHVPSGGFRHRNRASVQRRGPLEALGDRLVTNVVGWREDSYPCGGGRHTYDVAIADAVVKRDIVACQACEIMDTLFGRLFASDMAGGERRPLWRRRQNLGSSVTRFIRKTTSSGPTLGPILAALDGRRVQPGSAWGHTQASSWCRQRCPAASRRESWPPVPTCRWWESDCSMLGLRAACSGASCHPIPGMAHSSSPSPWTIPHVLHLVHFSRLVDLQQFQKLNLY